MSKDEYKKVAKRSWERRFNFLAPALGTVNSRYTLHGPDILDPRWTVFDTTAKRTVGRGESPERAVDTAIHNTR